jgi:transcriptional regulator with XRE-family HTH domain
VPDKTIETLAEFVKRVRLSKGLTLPDVERQSGGQITNGYVSRIENGQSLNPSVDKLKALAKGLRIKESELFDVAQGKVKTVKPSGLSDDSEFASITLGFQELSEADKTTLRPLLQMLRREIEERNKKQ